VSAVGANEMAGVPFKVCVPSKNGLQLGVVASSLEHLGAVLEQKLGIAPQMRVYLGDGTLVCDEEYFQLLKPQTKLTVVEEREIFQGACLRTIVRGENIGCKTQGISIAN